MALDKALARLSEIEEALGESEELAAARAVIEEKAGVVRGFRAQQTDVELTVDEVRAKAAEIEKKLYSGSVTNPKELQDYDADHRSLKELTRRREDELLALMVQMDEADTDLKAAETEFASIHAEWGRGQEEMLTERARIEPEVERLREIRGSQVTGFERSLLGLYDLLRERRGGRAVARIERGMCQGCRISLPTSVMQKVRIGTGVIQCVSCERILLLD